MFGGFLRWFGSGGATAERTGAQNPLPSQALIAGTTNVGVDGALQISTVWACVDRRSTTIASLPFFAYKHDATGRRTLARTSRLYALLHDSPNARMTPLDFWRALIMNHDLRGTGYARIERDERTDEATALWPMPTDQVTPSMLPDGTMIYEYRIGKDVMVLDSSSVLPIKGLGNGNVGLSRLEYMRATTDEAAKAQTSASKVFGTGGKPTGVLMVDKVLRKEQREALRTNFSEMSVGSESRLFVLEADMKYQQLSISPEDQQLLESRNFGVEEVCRWFDVPPVLVHHSNVTTWGTGVEQIVDGFYKLSVRPMLVNIEQAVRKHVMTPAQRASMSVEFNLDALLRGNSKDRMELHAKAVQNGLRTRNECRQLENDEPDPSPAADILTAQSNLVPLHMLGQTTNGGSNAPAQDPIAQ